MTNQTAKAQVHVQKMCGKSCPTLATPWTVAHQAPLSMGFSRQDNWSELPCPSPGDLSNPGIEPALQADSLQGKPTNAHAHTHIHTHTHISQLPAVLLPHLTHPSSSHSEHARPVVEPCTVRLHRASRCFKMKHQLSLDSIPSS